MAGSGVEEGVTSTVGVAVGATCVAVGVTGVLVGVTGVLVGVTGVLVGVTGVLVGVTGVGLGVMGVEVASGVGGGSAFSSQERTLLITVWRSVAELTPSKPKAK